MRVRRLLLALAVFATALSIRVGGTHEVPPFDDAYHWKRIAWSVEHFPRVLTFDSDRGIGGAYCPWPPLYDVAMGGIAKVIGLERIVWVPPILFSLLCALCLCGFDSLAVGGTLGLGLALSPYLIGVSQVGSIDHHWVEPWLVLGMLAARKKPWLLGVAMAAALFVQTALIVACGLVFVVSIGEPQRHRGFAMAAGAIALYRIAQPLPGGPWFLGWTHVALLTAAAVVLALWPRWYALPLGIAVMLPFLPDLLIGAEFFRGDPWLASIAEFQPMLRNYSSLGTDLANLGGGVLAGALCLRGEKRKTLLVSGAYLVLAISSRRFLVPGIASFVLSGALAAACSTRAMRIVAVVLTLAPPIAYDGWALAHREKTSAGSEQRMVASEVAALPGGRVLAPWHLGHAIDVLGRHPVVIDNFGSMPDDSLFATANDALLQRHPDVLAAWMRERGIRYLVIPDRRHLAATAVCAGVNADEYRETSLARSTVWWRLHEGESLPGFIRRSAHVFERGGTRSAAERTSTETPR